jgi:tape measure domain-containing protein
MPEIDPVTLQLRADVGQYEATIKQTTSTVDQLLERQEKSSIRLADTINQAADRMIAAFERASNSAKDESQALMAAKQAESVAAEKAAAAMAAAEKVQRDAEERLAAAAKEAAAKVEAAKEQVAKAATTAAAEEARAVQEAAIIEERANRTKLAAAKEARLEADRTARAAEKAARDEQKAQQAAAKAAEKAAADKIRAAKAAEDALSSSGNKILKLAGSAFAGVSALALAKQFLDIADASKSLDAQLRLATAGFGSFSQAQKDVQKIAADTRSGLEETASLYGNFSRGAKELGADQADAARATETFSKALKIGGADANEAASATLQFGQALASGVLRGDELNSILEASPRLGRLFAESMGVSIGQVRKLGEEGKLTADKLLNALTNTKFTAGIDAEFRELPVTFDQAMTQVSNAAIITFGAFDRGGQFSTALANFVSDGASGFGDLEHSAEEFGISARADIEGLVSAFAPVFAEGQRLFDFLSGGFKGVDIGRDIDKSLGQIDKVTAYFADDPLSRALGIKGSNFQGRYRAGQQKAQSRLRGEQGERAVNALISPYLDRFGRPVQRTAPSKPATPSASSGGAGGRRSGGPSSAEANAKKAEREREKAIRDDAAKVRDAAQLQDDINAARAALAVAANDVLAFNLADIESQRKQRVADAETQEKLGKLSQQEFTQRTAAANEIARLQSQRAQQIADEANRRDALDVAQAGFKNEQDILRAQEGLTDIRKERREVELRLVDLAYEQEQVDLKGVLASKEANEAQKKIARDRLALLPELRGYDRAKVAQDNESPLQGYARKLGETDIGDQVEGYVVDELQHVQDGISSALQKAIGTKDPLITGLLNLFIQQVIMKPLADALAGAAGGESGGGVLGSLISAGASLFGGARASGGRVNAGSLYRVNEAAGAGRVEGFMPDQSGTIIPLGRMNAASRGGGTTIVHAPQFNLRGAVVTKELYADMQRISDQSAARAGQAAYGQSMRDAPGAVRRAQRFRTT